MTLAKTMSVRQAALTLQCSQKWVRDLLYEGKLAGSRKCGRVWLISADAIEGRLKARQTEGQPEQAP
jgi:excisionase family DNA binding protein